MRIVTWNVNSLKVRFPHLEILLNEHKPDFICLQETKTEDQNFLKGEIESLDYSVVYHGQKTYNGVAILSREKMFDIQVGLSLIHI